MPRIIDRSRVVSVRLSRAEHAAAQAEAQAAGAPIGAWLRLRMLDAQDSRERLAAIEARLAELVAAVSDKPSIGQMQKFLDVYRSAAAKAAPPVGNHADHPDRCAQEHAPMIRPTIIKNGAKAADYYSDVEKAAEYYGGERIPSAWTGKGSAIAGLSGRVNRDDLTAILSGKITDSSGERQLGRIKADGAEHRAGYDFTISAPKSVSVEALVHGNKAVLEAHRDATAAALRYLETYAETRVARETVRTSNLAIATYEHVSSRAGDPQLHTHALVANVTYHKGKAYSLESKSLFQRYRTADAIYHQELSRHLKRAGLDVRHDRDGRVELAGYTRSDLKDFSTRSAEIEAALAARGLTRETASATSRETAALDTRSTKTLPETRSAHLERWTAQAEALGLKPAARDPAIAREARRADGWTAAEIAGAAVQKAAAHLTSTEAVFREKDLHMQAARFSAGRCDWADIEHALTDAEAKGELIREPGPTAAAERLTTRAMVESERRMADALERGRGDHQAVMSEKEFSRALARFERERGFHLSGEQRGAAAMILTGRDTFQGVQGLAGTGKTTLLAFVREAAEAKGWRVAGHSNGAEQAATMQRESGIVTTTTAAHLLQEQSAAQERGRESPDDTRELRIMDEASQSGQAQFNRVIESTVHAGARTVFLGDKLQHQSVEAGRAFERAQQHMPTATLGEASIRRQRTDHLIEVVHDVLAGRHGAAVRKVATIEVRTTQAALPDTATRDERRAAARADNAAVIQCLARDYAGLSREERGKTLVLTSTNSDRMALNSAIRAELQQRGELGAGVTVETLRKAAMTAEELKRAESFVPGQIVEVQNDYRRAELARGARFEVAEIRGDLLTLRNAGGRVAIVDPSAIKLQAYDRDTREVAIGDRLRWTENHRAQRQDHPLEDGLKVRNGAGAVVERVRADRVTLRCADGERIELDPSVGQKIEHSYATTSHGGQGRSQNPWWHFNTEAGRHGDRESLVNLTRAIDSARIYTQDADKAARQAGIVLDKTAAHDIVPHRDEHQQLEQSPASDFTAQPDHDTGHAPEHNAPDFDPEQNPDYDQDGPSWG